MLAKLTKEKKDADSEHHKLIEQLKKNAADLENKNTNAIENLKKEKEDSNIESRKTIEDLLKKIEDMNTENKPIHKDDQFGTQGVVSTNVEAKVHDVTQEFECRAIEEKIRELTEVVTDKKTQTPPSFVKRIKERGDRTTNKDLDQFVVEKQIKNTRKKAESSIQISKEDEPASKRLKTDKDSSSVAYYIEESYKPMLDHLWTNAKKRYTP